MIDSVLISPYTDIFYQSFYYLGLRRLFGQHSIRFTTKPFQAVKRSSTFAFILPIHNGTRKIIIDSADSSKFDDTALDWCDVYGKVNFLEDEFPASYKQKILPIGPSFGVRIWSLPMTVGVAVRNYLLVRNELKDTRNFLANYWRQYKYRVGEEDLRQIPSKDNYVFFTSSIWKREPETNIYRKNFIESCRQIPNLEFEGGFIPRKKNDVQGFENFYHFKRYSHSEYIRKTQQSLASFNTPAVMKCHGWKLGEYLALGKAIISTMITREMPGEFEAGKHYLLTDGSVEDMKSILVTLKSNASYRQQLEKSARDYYCNYLAPQVVVQRLIRHTA